MIKKTVLDHHLTNYENQLCIIFKFRLITCVFLSYINYNSILSLFLFKVNFIKGRRIKKVLLFHALVTVYYSSLLPSSGHIGKHTIAPKGKRQLIEHAGSV